MNSDDKKPGNNIWEELLEHAKRTEDAASAVLSDARQVHVNVEGTVDADDDSEGEKAKAGEGFDSQMRTCLGRIRSILDEASKALSSLK